MRLWKIFLITAVILSVAGFVLIPISQIQMQATSPFSYPIIISYYPFDWLLLPALIILAIGIVLTIYGYFVKRTYG